MNLIEQLGGYEKAKRSLWQEQEEGYPGDEIADALLEYRRQHNIYETGDWVKLPDKFYSIDTIHKIERIENLSPNAKSSELTYFLDNGLGCWKFQIEHATDKEIEARRRLHD